MRSKLLAMVIELVAGLMSIMDGTPVSSNSPGKLHPDFDLVNSNKNESDDWIGSMPSVYSTGSGRVLVALRSVAMHGKMRLIRILMIDYTVVTWVGLAGSVIVSTWCFT